MSVRAVSSMTAAIEAEGAFLGDADAIDAGRHEQEPVDLAVERVAGEARDVGDGERADRDDEAAGIDAAGEDMVERGIPVLDRELRAFAGRAEKRDAVAALFQERPAMLQEQAAIGPVVGRHGRGRRHDEAIGFRQAGHVTSVGEMPTQASEAVLKGG